ncbi:MAG: hypothetical protein ACOYIG_10385 [Acetivibrionales bacterium]|jgi:hypothetical protein|nr:hypothetical protein [Clostridiaceae bacterium]
MKHLFSSGEAMHKKNVRELSEGVFEGEYLEYDKVDLDTKFFCSGVINNKKVRLSFTLSELGYEDVSGRLNFGILMQSDILLAEWKDYELLDLEI